jgi:hypothetical protein
MLGFMQREGTFTCNMRLGIPHVSGMWLAFNIGHATCNNTMVSEHLEKETWQKARYIS